MKNLPEATPPSQIDQITGLLWAILLQRGYANAAFLTALAPFIHHGS
jgi:hypothetical protein